LHISGSGDADNILRVVSGGNCIDYIWNIPSDHPGGTYWYHSHHHGTTEAQVDGGAFGLLIVEESTSQNIPEWTFNEILLQISITLGHILANGNAYQVFNINADQWYRLRISLVDPSGVTSNLLFLSLEPLFATGCKVHKVASDGIWHKNVPGPQLTNFQMNGASRADFAIQCPSFIPTMNLFLQDKIVAIFNVGSPPLSPSKLNYWKPVFPFSLQGIASAKVSKSNKLQITIQRDSINDIEWNPNKPITTIAYDTVHEWEIGDSREHPFHMHLYHMLIVTPGGCGPHEEGQFYDTISGPPCKVRFKTADINKRCVFHCHVLFHSDSGSMGWVNVQNSDISYKENSTLQYSCPSIDQNHCKNIFH